MPANNRCLVWRHGAGPASVVGSSPTVTPPELPTRPPTSRTDLFVSFTLLALQGFGGVVAVVQREVVERRRWMTREAFLEEWAVAQVLPGPNVVNLSLMIGARYFGVGGALAAMAGMLTLPLLIILALAFFYASWASQPWMAGALRGMGAAAAGVIAASSLKLLPALKLNVLTAPVCYALVALTLLAVAGLRLPLVWVLAGLGLPACVLAWRRLKAQGQGMSA
ncbi:MAG: chromate transporter [Burkholderiaceae bacterium]